MARPGDAVLKWLDGAAEAARQARHDPRDADALHRFRVDARRLAVYAKIVEKPCGVPVKLRKRLRRALRATGAWRDAHVESIWMAEDGRLRGGERGAEALTRALSRDRLLGPSEPHWRREVDETLRKLRRAAEANSPKKSELRAASREAAEKEWRRLARRLNRLNADSKPAALHEARAAARNLRYILEESGSPPRGLPAPEALRRLQTALGGVHDRDVIAAHVGAAPRRAELAAPKRSALARLVRERRELLIQAQRCWRSLLGEQPRAISARLSRRRGA